MTSSRCAWRCCLSTLASQVKRAVPHCEVVSMADLVAPALAGPCLGEGVGGLVEIDGGLQVVGDRIDRPGVEPVGERGDRPGPEAADDGGGTGELRRLLRG